MTDDQDEDIDGMERHAPTGYEPYMQFFDGETKRQAIKEAMKIEGLPETEFVAVPGHFACDTPEEENEPDARPTFRPFGWMVFRKKD